MRKLKELFISLTVRNYRLFFMGQLISVIGTWVQRTAMSWYVYRLTHSPLLLGVVGFLSMIPALFISPFAGAWADRWDRRKTLIGTQILFMLQASLLAVGVLTGFINELRWWPLLVLALFQGCIDSVDAPFRQNFVLDLVGNKSLLPNAIATNSAMFNSARLLGPTIGGIMIVLVGEGICFLINALSYLAVISSLIAIRIQYHKPPESKENIFAKIKEGWSYSWRNLPIRWLIANLGIFMLFAMSYTSIIPVFARDVLKGNAGTQGLLLTCAGVGALVSAIYMAGRKTIKGLPWVSIIMGIIGSLGLIGFSQSTSLWLSMFMMVFVGMGLTIQMAITNTLLQTISYPSMRGRVLSVYTMTLNSLTPFGSLLLGWLTREIGPHFALTICAGVCLLWVLSGIKIVPKVSQNILRMLVKNKNTELYRPITIHTVYSDTV
ncbi:MAG TPA: MFS transporter [Candidatus Syntrophosphaera sp.]|jgi:MFS family permease|nr:MFS transporter [Candidatus Syntrophosphaera sp.]OQB05462.1 MAG: enterobactin exporter EntS [Candidatus Cloacimonetes bacterium ADurb.Bin211]HOD59356.1 MFS transporter [Candidatus Syntrophosphaera sp.]HQM79438.1 MFS transporter [Candidatus Syntrophosphaera sp.]